MALELNQLVQVEQTGKYLWATDKSGEYSAENLTGWGNPNFELNESALGVIVMARDTDRTVYASVSPRWKFSASADNATENVFQVTYTKDSIIDVYMIKLMATYDNTTSIDGVLFTEGHYFYNATDAVVYKIESGIPVLVEDMTELVDALPTLEALDGNTVSVLCSDAYVVNLAIEYGKEYKNYVLKRTEGCDNLQKIFFDMLNFKEDIIGARRSYTSGLFSKAQSTIETLTEEKNIQ